MVNHAGDIVEVQSVIALVIAVVGLSLQGDHVGDCAGSQIHLGVVVAVGVVSDDGAVIQASHSHDIVQIHEGEQLGQLAGGQIHLVDGVAVGHFAPLCVIDVTQDQHAVVGSVVSHVADLECPVIQLSLDFVLCVTDHGQVLGDGSQILSGTDGGTLVGLGVQNEQVVLHIVAVNSALSGSHGSNRDLLTLGQVGDQGSISTADGSPAAVGDVVGQECSVSSQNSDLAGCGLGDLAVGSGCSDDSLAAGDTGDNAVGVNGSHGLVGGSPDDVSIQGQGQGVSLDLDGVAFGDAGLAGLDQQVVQRDVGLLGEVLAEDVQACDLCACSADGAQGGSSGGLSVDDGQAGDIAGALEQGSPVQVAGIVVVRHGCDHVALDAGVANDGQRLGNGIDLVQSCVGVHAGLPAELVHLSNGGLHCVQAVVGSCQAHEELLGLHQQDQLAGLHVHDVQVGSVVAGTCNGVHGRGVVVVGDVIDEGIALAQIHLLFHSVADRIHDEHLPVAAPVVGIVTESVQLAIVVLFSPDDIVGSFQNVGIAGVGSVQTDPVLAAVGSQVGQDVTVDVVSSFQNLNIEGTLEGVAANAVGDGVGDGCVAVSDAQQGALLGDLHDRLVGGDQDSGLLGCVEGSNGDVGGLFSAGQHQHILCGDAVDCDLSQSGDLSGDGVHTHELDQAGVGGIAQGNDVGQLILEVDPVNLACLRIGPQQDVIVVVVAHGLHVLQGTQTLHQDLAADVAVLNVQLEQRAGVVQSVDVALDVAGQSHQVVVVQTTQLHQLTVVQVDSGDGGVAHVVVDGGNVHQAGGVVVSHVGGSSAGGLAQLDSLVGLQIQAPELAALGEAVVVTIVTIVVSSDEVDGGDVHQLVAGSTQIHVDHVTVVTIVGEVVVSVEVAVHVHNGNGAGSGDIAMSGGDDSVALCNSSDDAVLIDGSDSLIGGGPLNVGQVIVPGQGICHQSGGLADAQNSGDLIQPQGLQSLSSGDLVVGGSQGVQAQNLGAGIVLHQIAGFVVSHRSIDIGLCSHGLHVDADQAGGIAAPGGGVVAPVQDAVLIGHGLCVVGVDVGAVGVGDDDGVAVSVGDGNHFIVLVQSEQVCLAVLDSVQGAVVIVSQCVGTVVVVAVAVQLGQLTGQQVQSTQVGVIVLLGDDVHGVGGIVEGHIQDVDAQVAQGDAIPQAGGHHDQVVNCIHSEDLAADELSSVDGSVLHVIVGMNGDLSVLLSGSGLVHGDPAIHMVGVDVVVVSTVAVQLGGVHTGQVVASAVVGDLVVALVTCVVTQDQSEGGAQTGDVQIDNEIAVGVLGEVGLLAPDLSAGVVGDEHVSQSDIISSDDAQSALSFAFHGLEQSGTLGIDGDGDLDGVLTAVGIVDLGGDGQVDLGVVGQVLTVSAGEVVHAAAVPGVQPGDDLAIAGDIHGLACVVDDFHIQNLAGLGVGVGDGQFLHVTQQGQIHLVQAVQNAVAVGGDGVVGGIINDVAVLVGGDTGVGVEAQDPVGAHQVGPHDVVVLVALGQAVGGSSAPEAVIVPVSGIECGSIGPVAVEAQEGQVQLVGDDAFFGGGVQVDIAFHIAAVLPALCKVCLVLVGQCDGNGDLSGGTCSNGDRLLVEGNGAAQFLVHAVHEVLDLSLAQAHAGSGFGHQDGIEGVGLALFGDVVDLEGEGVSTVGICAQLTLGHVAVDGQVSVGGDSLESVHQTSTLLTGRHFDAGVSADDGISGGHQQSVCHGTQGTVALTLAAVAFLQVLHDQSGHTGNLGSGHGGTGHQAVTAAVVAGVDITADTGQVRLQAQVGGNAPGGEDAHLAALSRGTLTGLGGDDQSLVLSGSHLLAVLQGDQTGGDGGIGDAVVRDLHTEVVDILRDVVPDQNGDGASGLGVADLGAEAQLAAADHSDLAFDQAVALGIIVIILVAQAVDDVVLQLFTSHVDQCVVVLIGVGVEDLGTGSGQVGSHDHGVLSGSDGGSIDVSTGLADGSVVGVLGTVQIGAPHVVVGAGAFVTCRDGSDDILLSQTGIDQVDLSVAGGEACSRAQGQVDNVTAQGHGVFQSSHDVIGVSTTGSAEDLQDDQLCLGSHTNDGSAFQLVGSSDTGNVGAVVALVVSAVVSSQAVVHIVESEGDLTAAVQGFGSDGAALCVSVQILQDGINVVGGQGILGQGGLSRKRGVIQIQTGIDDSDLHAFAVVAQILPDLCNAGHIAGSCSVGVGGAGFGDAGVVDGHQVDALDAVHHSDLTEVTELSGDGEGVGQVGELVANFQLHAFQDVLLDIGDNGILLLQQLLFSGSGHGLDGSVGFSQGLLLHHDECGDHIAGLVDLSSFLQLCNAFGSLGDGQGCVQAFHAGSGPGAVCGGLDIGLDDGIVTQVGRTGGVARSHDPIVFEAGVGDLCCLFCLCCGDAVSGGRHGGNRGSQQRHHHANGQKHGQQAFDTHFHTSLVYFVGHMEKRPLGLRADLPAQRGAKPKYTNIPSFNHDVRDRSSRPEYQKGVFE